MITRRQALWTLAGIAGVGWLPGHVAAGVKPRRTTRHGLPQKPDDRLHWAPHLHVESVIAWGDDLATGARHPDIGRMTELEQLQRFGFNCDFNAFLPDPGSQGASGLLCVNHEYGNPWMMIPGYSSWEDARDNMPAAELRVEMASMGHSVLHVARTEGRWHPVAGPHARRITPHASWCDVSGPAAGHRRLMTSADPTGRVVNGILANCSGGVTPWGTVLIAEENVEDFFEGQLSGHPEERSLRSFGVAAVADSRWSRVDGRFSVDQEPHELNRFGWIVEIDPRDPTRRPIKRTALGRFKHECAVVASAADGRVVVYLADDQRFECLYRYVSARPWRSGMSVEESGRLLDEGVLTVGKFQSDGSLRWLPLEQGRNGLVASEGFRDQGDVMIEARHAAATVGATPMDRPEGIALCPRTGRIMVMFSGNTGRPPERVDPGNPIGPNLHGHALELTPGKGDHGAGSARWKVHLTGGAAAAGGGEDWLSNPDNCAFDPDGGLWICSDTALRNAGIAEGLWRCVRGDGAPGVVTERLLAAPIGAELTGPCFHPSGRSLFLSVQHPGEGRTSTFANPTTRWPDFEPGVPPRPGVVVVSRKDGRSLSS